MSIGPGQWYVRMRGRVLGPFSPSQLASLRDRGRLTDDHELSQDRRSWMRASEMPGVFALAAPRGPQPAQAVELEWPVSSSTEEAPAQAQNLACRPGRSAVVRRTGKLA